MHVNEVIICYKIPGVEPATEEVEPEPMTLSEIDKEFTILNMFAGSAECLERVKSALDRKLASHFKTCHWDQRERYSQEKPFVRQLCQSLDKV